MITISVDFTKSGSFAVWESGSFNPKTNLGWAGLVAGPDGQPQQAIFERNPQTSKYHYLVKVTTGSIVVVTNIGPLPNSNLFRTRILVGRIDSLGTRAGAAGSDRPEVTSSTTLLWSESFLNKKANIASYTEELEVFVPGLSDEVLASIKSMIVQSVIKAMTPASEQRMFWCTKREVVPSKKRSQKLGGLDEATSHLESECGSDTSQNEGLTDQDLQDLAESSASVQGLINRP
jgi:hypothetical protein